MTTTLSNSKLTATIKQLGAELISLKSNEKEYVWEGNPEFWGKHSPILFPIVGSLKNNTYTYNGISYHLERHGFARDNEFVLISKNENSVVFSLKANQETLKVYPFHFELQLLYTLTENSLEIQYRVINNENVPMPFSIGGHPAFALNAGFENYKIEFEETELLTHHLLEDGFISDKTDTLVTTKNQVPLNYQLFENEALVFKNLKSRSLVIFECEKPFLKVNYKTFPHLGIWTKVNAPFLCIEPWFGYADTAANNGNIMTKEGIQILEPNSKFEAQFSIEIL